MKKYTGFAAMFLVNAVLIYAANWLYPNHFVLGSYTMSVIGAIISASLIWTVLTWLTQPLLTKFKINLGKGIGMMAVYLVANFVSLWLIGRLGPAVGFGISSFVWVFALAFVANIAQFLVWVLLAKLKLAEM